MITDKNSLFINSEGGNDSVVNIHNTLERLIENDKEYTSENRLSPTIWELSWINDNSQGNGYHIGDCVWLNTETVSDIVLKRYSVISSYVIGNPQLSEKFELIDRDDSSEVVKFFKKVVTGTAHPDISALYYIGDITLNVLIMIAVDQPRDGLIRDFPLETSPYWKPVLSAVTYDMMYSLLFVELSNVISEHLNKHLDEYHIPNMPPNEILQKFVSKLNGTDIDSISKYYYYSHSLTTGLNGFDYVVDFKYDKANNIWYRFWNSGYLELGGYINNTGDRVLEVLFLKNYNYPSGLRFYEEGYNTYDSMSINGGLTKFKRYIATVTPVVGVGYKSPYSCSPYDLTDSGSYTYVNVDITNFKNSGFSLLNLDESLLYFSRYSFYVAGYTTVLNATGTNTLNRSSYNVNFYDTLA